MSFNNLGLLPALVSQLSLNGYELPTPIQKQAIPEILKGKDVLAVAKTGSGKTAGYALPMLQNLHGKVSLNRHVHALVLVPTRELAIQVTEVIVGLSKALPQPLITIAVYGGASINPQMKKLNTVDVLVATPGRLIELLELNAVHLADLKMLVLDEADKMLSLGFKQEVNTILKLLPQKRQNLLFTATQGEAVQEMHRVVLTKPVLITIQSQVDDIALIKQEAYRVLNGKRGLLLRHLITERNLNQVLIFCASTYQVEHVTNKLNLNGIKAKAIHSKKAQGTRKQNLADFKNGALTGVRCLVTTDLLSRGIDIAFLPTVVNYELPRSPKDFIHRIGRTGRAENPGTAISFITKEEAHHWRVIQKKNKLKIWTEDLPEWNAE